MPNTKKSDLRRARSGMCNLCPTSTGSATAIVEIYPELKGKLNGLAVRVPLLNASLTDCVFEVKQKVTVEQVNEALKSASESGPLKGILGTYCMRIFFHVLCFQYWLLPFPQPPQLPALNLLFLFTRHKGYETKALVSTDYTNDTRSAIIDALSTQVIDGTLVKIYAWYDNEAGYSKRMAELCNIVAAQNVSTTKTKPTFVYEWKYNKWIREEEKTRRLVEKSSMYYPGGGEEEVANKGQEKCVKYMLHEDLF